MFTVLPSDRLLRRCIHARTTHFPCLHLALKGSSTLVGSDIVHQSLHVGNWADREQVHTEDDAPSRHELSGDLAPPARGSAQVNAHLRRAEEVILLVDLVIGAGEREAREGLGTHVGRTSSTRSIARYRCVGLMSSPFYRWTTK